MFEHFPAIMPYVLAILAIYVCWKFLLLLIMRQFGFDVIDRLRYYGGGDLRRDRKMGFFGGSGRGRQ